MLKCVRRSSFRLSTQFLFDIVFRNNVELTRLKLHHTIKDERFDDKICLHGAAHIQCVHWDAMEIRIWRTHYSISVCSTSRHKHQ